MRNALVLLVALVAVPAFAGDGTVSRGTLASLGLGGMQQMSDAEGMQIRGQASSAMVIGTSLIFGQLVSPDTKNFEVGSDVNMVQASDDQVSTPAAAFKEHVSLLSLSLSVTQPTTNLYTGTLSGFAGGAGAAQGGGAAAPNFFGMILSLPTPALP